jgi:hypothetical protein
VARDTARLASDQVSAVTVSEKKNGAPTSRRGSPWWSRWMRRTAVGSTW